MLPLKDKETLDNLNVDFRGLSNLSHKLNVIGVHAFYLPEENPPNKVYTRNFAPLVGINEEAATGTSNGSLIYFFKKKQDILKRKLLPYKERV